MRGVCHFVRSLDAMNTQGSECDPRVDDDLERGLGLAREKACEEKGARGLTGEGRNGRKLNSRDSQMNMDRLDKQSCKPKSLEQQQQ